MALLIGGGLGLFVLFTFMWIARFLYLCRPSEILIFSGRKHLLPDGTDHRIARRVRRACLAHPDHRDRPADADAVDADRRVGAGRVHEGRHSAEGAGDRA